MKIYLTKGVESSPISQRVLAAYPSAEIISVEDTEEARLALYEEEKETGKQNIFLTRFKGQSFKVCPGTEKPYICCYYWTLNQATNCPFDCTYCILQYYLNNPILTVYTNMDLMYNQMDERMGREPQRLFRVGTGELADSLALDDITQAGPELIRYASTQKNMLFELKTKSDKVDHLLKCDHKGKTVMSWSLNPQEMIGENEARAASLKRRMAAVDKVQVAGYKLGFHFDPLLYYPDWKQGYTELIETLFSHADPKNITWISIGSMRFPPDMKEKMLHKFPETNLAYGEMIRGRDNKMRYFKPLRVEMYRHIYSELQRCGGPDLFVYFCMELPDVWEDVMGFIPESNEHLDFLFAEYITNKFPELNYPHPEKDAYKKFETIRSWE